MKRILICLLTFLSIGLNLQAQTVSVADIEALSSGETVQFKLHVSDVTAMTSMHFEVELPATFSVTGVSATSDWAAMFSREGGVVGAISSSDNALKGEGDAATVSVSIPPGTAVGEYPVTIDNIRINGAELGTPVVFNINVVAQHTVVLDELSTTAPENATGVNVTVKRTINANEWSTICLPFDMTEAKVKEIFGDDVQLAYFTSYDVEKDGTDVTSITINFEDDDLSEGFYANYPYLIKTSKDITEFSLTTDITPDDVQESYSAGKGANKKSGKFIGTYQANTVVPENTLFLSGNNFWYSTGQTKMKAFRAYFDFMDVLSEVENASSRVVMKWDDEQPTGISEIKHETQKNSQYYDLSGRRVVRPNKGVYIVDGKKTVIK